ncbi:MAG: hypothetical protein QM497_02325 [Sulfurimonas sp.]
MFKITMILAIAFSIASSFSFNATMCDKVAMDPHQMMPEECRNYSEKEAEKAFNKTKKKHESRKDIIKFSKDADDKQN